MREYSDSVSSAVTGLPVYHAEISVLKADSTAASLFSDAGITPLAQPVLTDGLGQFSFFVADGTYTLVVADPGGGNARSFPNTEIYEDARNVSVPVGEAGVTIPSIAVRANRAQGYDSAGLPVAFDPFTGTDVPDAIAQESLLRATGDSDERTRAIAAETSLSTSVSAVAADVTTLQGDVTALGAAIAAAALGGVIGVKKDTQAHLYADLAWAAGTIGWVYADATAAKNDLYLKSGASGSGSWSAPLGVFATAALAYVQPSVDAAAASASAAAASAAAIVPAINADTLVDFVQHAWTSAPYNADGTVTITATGNTFRIDVMTPELLAARIAGTPVTFVLEVVSGSFSSVNLREYTLPNGQFGGGTATTTAMTLSGGRYSVTKTLIGTDQSIDVVFTTAGTATVKPLGTATGGTAARPSADPALLTAQSLVSNAANDPSDIAYTAGYVQINSGSPTLANGVFTIPNGANGAIDFIFPKALVDGDTGVAYFSIDVPPGNIFNVNTTYDVSGGGSPDSSVPQPQIEKIGPTDYRVIFQVLAATPGLIFYSLRLVFNNTYAITRNVSKARFFKGSTLPRVMTVPKVISDAIATATQAESDAGPLVRRMWILADSVFQSATISFTSASVYMQQYLGVRARLKNLAVPGSGLRAMLAMAGISAAPPSTGPIVTVTSNQIPAWDGTGAPPSVQITAWTGDPVTAFYKINTAISMTTYLRGVKMTLRPTAFDGNFFPTTMYLDRVSPGPMIPVPAGSQLISEQAFQMRDDFVMLEGSINASNPAMTVLQGAAAFFAARDALSPTTHSLYMPNLIGVPLTTPVSRNTGHADTATLVGLYGATRILDLNAAGIPGGNFLTTGEASMLATAGFSPDSTDNAYMALGWRPPGLAYSDHYHPNDLCSLLIGYRIVNCSAVQSYMENLA